MNIIEKGPTENPYPIVDLYMEGVETEADRQINWVDEGLKRRIVYSVLGGGEWGDTWIKALSLSSTDKLVGTELMRVEVTKNTTTNEVGIAVFVQVLKYNSGKPSLIDFAYTLENDGRIEELGRTEIGGFAMVEEYIEALKTESIRTLPDLPERIDVEETIRLFLEQIEERRMQIPVLIPIS